MGPVNEVRDYLQHRGLEVTGEELLDLLWVHHVEGLSEAGDEPEEESDEAPPEFPGENPREEEKRSAPEDREPVKPYIPPPPDVFASPIGASKEEEKDEEDAGSEEPDDSDAGELFYPGESDPVETSSRVAQRVETLAGRSVPEPFSLAQSLLPLRERRMTADRRFVDIDSMIDGFCRNGGIWEFHPVRKREPSHEIVIVLEQTPSVLFWEAMAEELAGVFTDVLRVPCHCRFLRFEEDRASLSKKNASANGRSGSDRGLLQPGRRKLLIVLTDGTSLAWQDGRMGDVLRRWAGVHPTTLLLPFSRELAMRTELGNARIGHGRVNGFGMAEWSARPEGGGPPVFLLTLDSPMLSAWTHAVRSDPSGFIAAADFPRLTNREFLEPVGSAAERGMPVDGDALLRHFRETAARPTRELASLLAAVPLFPPVMRLVQEVFRRGSTHLQMAEFFYSGLIYRVTDDPSVPPDDVLYDFRPVLEGQQTLRDRLLNHCTFGDTDEVLRAVGSYVGSRFGEDGRRFESLLLGDEGDQSYRIPERLQPFARVFGEVLRRTQRTAVADDLLRASGETPPDFEGTEPSGTVGEDLVPPLVEEETPVSAEEDVTPNENSDTGKTEAVSGDDFTNSAGVFMKWFESEGRWVSEKPVRAEEFQAPPSQITQEEYQTHFVNSYLSAHGNQKEIERLDRELEEFVARKSDARTLEEKVDDWMAVSRSEVPENFVYRLANGVELGWENGDASYLVLEPEAAVTAENPPDILENSAGMTMIGFAPGTFTMGSPEDEPGRDDDDMPQHEVTLTYPFHIAKTPVTQGQWRSVMGTSLEEQKVIGNAFGDIMGTGEDHPMYFVSWEDALRFCDQLTEREIAEGKVTEEEAYTLPTEAQWEMACRGGTSGPYNVEGAKLAELGWFGENSNSSTQPVGQKLANSRGLQDCHGNVWEWCAAWFERSDSTELQTDPTGPENGESRVMRGGSWDVSVRDCRSAYRGGYGPGDRSSLIGFRPVLTTSEQRAKLPELKPEPEAETKNGPEDQPPVEQWSGPGGLTFNRIPAGTFTMGSPEDEEGRHDGETAHEVTLKDEFWMAETPVTQAQWVKVMGRDTPSQSKDSGPDEPVGQVSWEDAQAFCAKLNEEEVSDGWEYALPTEAQWEYACRAGTDGRFNVEGAELSDLGWFSENSELRTHPVKEKSPNLWGLYDCHGNVFEWCQDWFQDDLGSEAQTDPEGPENGERQRRVIRGGSWDDSAQNCRSACRTWIGRSGLRRVLMLPRIGFRPVRRKKTEPAEGAELEAETKSEPAGGTRSEELRSQDFENPIGMKMLRLGAGEFTMREGVGAHPVTLTEDYYIAETPLTQGQWERVMGENPSHFKEVGPEAPVEKVSWLDAVEFCRRLNAEASPPEGWEYALPTEAQWEYACRAGTTTNYWWGDAWLEGKANAENGPHSDGQKRYFESRDLPTESTMPVRTFDPNPWGLYDVSGNVWEWCQDWYQEDLGSDPQTDPEGPPPGGGRVMRGGCWCDSAQGCRSAYRYRSSPDDRYGSFGFRPVLIPKTENPEPGSEPTQEAETQAGARSEELVALDMTNSVGARMLCLPVGTFTMGSPPDEEGREPEYAGKETQHEVSLTEFIWMAKTPVTQGQWRTVMGTTVEEQKAKGNDDGEVTRTGADHPMYFVNWEEALRFCDVLTRKEVSEGKIREDLAYTLPTEAQWEWACRAGTKGPYAGSSLDQLGWYAENSDRTTHPVGGKKENAWGLQDMHGNVLEWCSVWYQEDLGSEPQTDPKGPDSGGNRVVRGGSWNDSAQFCRSAYRHRSAPGYRNSLIGFRPILANKEQRAKLGVLSTEPEAATKFKPEERPEVEQRSGAMDAPVVPGEKHSGPAGMTFVSIPAGTFLMGSPPDEEGRLDNETRHEVTLTRDFEIAETPVTQKQWQEIMGNHPSHFPEKAKTGIMKRLFGGVDPELAQIFRTGWAKLPVEMVSWDDAVKFCEELSRRDVEYDYALPTEAQWEYACRAGTSGPYNVDGGNLKELGWYDGNSGGKTHPVKEKRPNGWGLYDCHGNVWEWCRDWFEKDLGSDAQTDPKGPADGESRVLRGGGWNDSARDCRSAFRGRNDPGARGNDIGFRPVRTRKQT